LITLYRLVTVKTEVERAPGKSRSRWENNTKLDLTEIGCKHWDRGSESCSGHGCMPACLCVRFCLAMCRSSIQGVLPTLL